MDLEDQQGTLVSQISANILSAVLRHSITHPVVNDREATLWQQLQISCWPTLVILGPSNEILLILAGEGHSETTELFVRVAKGTIRSEKIAELRSVMSCFLNAFDLFSRIL